MSSPSDDPSEVAPGSPQPGPGDQSPSPVAPQAAYGGVRWQEPGVTVPRPPTVAEARRREKMRKAQEVAEEFARVQQENDEARASTRKKMLIGSVAVVGVVGVVALGYQMMDRTVDASCVKDGSNEVVPDAYCTGGHSSAGGVFIYAGAPYRYYYGGANRGVGTIASGGTLAAPSNKTAKTKSGTTVSRGGFGAGKSGSSGS